MSRNNDTQNNEGNPDCNKPRQEETFSTRLDFNQNEKNARSSIMKAKNVPDTSGLDLGIPRRHGIMPALNRLIRVESIMKSPRADAKVKSWHDDGA